MKETVASGQRQSTEWEENLCQILSDMGLCSEYIDNKKIKQENKLSNQQIA